MADQKTKRLLSDLSRKDLIKVIFNIASREASFITKIKALEKRVDEFGNLVISENREVADLKARIEHLELELDKEFEISGRMMIRNLELSGRVPAGTFAPFEEKTH